MEDREKDLMKRIESARRRLRSAQLDYNEADRLWRSMDRSYPDTYRNSEYWDVRDQLKGGYSRLNSLSQRVRCYEKELADLEEKLRRVEAEEAEGEGGDE
jgi:chromosome segregation ATPase